MPSVARRHVRLPVLSSASQQGLILLVVVKPSPHDILGLGIVLVLDVVHHHIALVINESVHNREYIRMR